MKTTSMFAFMFASVVAAVLCMGSAVGEVTISVTISGSVDEILPILQQLTEMGVGRSTPMAEGEDAVRLHVYSMTSAEETGTAGEGQPSVPKPVLELTDASVTPSAAKAGDSVLITVRVSDPEGKVDTLAVTLGDQSLDLYDNGSQGDQTANDGIWSRTVPLPADLAEGAHTLALTAFDVNGNAVAKETPSGPSVLKAEVALTVTK